jgi:hypothetical protein
LPSLTPFAIPKINWRDLSVTFDSFALLIMLITLSGILKIVEKFKNSSNKLLILFIFPQVGNENATRLSQLIEINYIIEEYLKEKLGRVKVICQYITKECKGDYNLNSLIERLKSNIKQLEEILLGEKNE